MKKEIKKIYKNLEEKGVAYFRNRAIRWCGDGFEAKQDFGDIGWDVEFIQGTKKEAIEWLIQGLKPLYKIRNN